MYIKKGMATTYTSSGIKYLVKKYIKWQKCTFWQKENWLQFNTF